jgi:hypothetical protein
MCSEKQRLANQQNALKSTGPKTTEGKASSRRNALEHGLTGAGTVLKRNDERKFRKTLIDWRQHLQPVDVLEECLVARAALAKVRMESCVKQDFAETGKRRRRALARWDDRQRQELAQATELLETEPERAIEQLEASSVCINWMVDQWKNLGAAIEETGC